MKNILKYIMILTLAVGVMSSCDDEYQAPNAGAKHSVIYSAEQSASNQVQVNGEISFGDASSGVQLREWSVAEGIGFIITDDSLSTSDMNNIKVVFNEAGTQEVKLHQEFGGDFYVGTTVRSSSYDTTIMVTVLDSVDVAFEAHYINDDGTVGAALTLQDGAKNQVTASKSVQFTYILDGSPQEVIWTFEGGDPAEVEYDGNAIEDGSGLNTVVKYKKIGVWDVGLLGFRDRPYGGDTLVYNDLIEVIPSTEPVILDQLVNDGNTIVLNYSREIDPASVNANNFAVSMENAGTAIPVNIASVNVDPSEGNLVIISLDGENIYDDDEVHVTYTPGEMRTTDLVNADAITDQLMDHAKGENKMAQNGYDVGMETSTVANWPYLYWGGNWGMYTNDIITTNPHLGKKSMVVNWEAGGGSIFDYKDDLGNNTVFNLETGKTYEVGFWIYVDKLGNADNGGLVPDFRLYPDDWSAELAFFFDDAFPTGEWVYQSTTWSPANTRDYFFMMRGYNASSTVEMEFYLDDFGIYELNMRP
ncbi:hypothetical protein BFP72_09690 [Reichenbachiella sp. 5M10]|uniref:SwmB domain-containing protein n=1 Tax=Reichenbachiella sp. 5M10 TaxID=1889772 RepID=UPI000C6056A4|nr:SwmB domain-containing protein [Reichenbachiella sp. 5M10]PIB35643.1 hypothetical protein BFP72_09690 [Reichenbachiella sp. 5M10]